MADVKRTRKLGEIRVGTLSMVPCPAGDVSTVALLPGSFPDVEAAEKAIRKGPPGDWAVVRLVRSFRVQRVERIEVTVDELVLPLAPPAGVRVPRWSGDTGEGDAPRFQNISCSSCGWSFGPGDEGFSTCMQHDGLAGKP